MPAIQPPPPDFNTFMNDAILSGEFDAEKNAEAGFNKAGQFFAQLASQRSGGGQNA